MQIKSLRGKDFITISAFKKEEIEIILNTARRLKEERRMGVKHEHLQGKSLFIIFYNRSLRTRNSFECGIMQLGGHANYLDSDKVYTPAMEGDEAAYSTERVSDVANVLARYGEGIAIRIYGKPTNWVYGAGNRYIREFARCADIPVINMEDDVYHPCQGMADLLTMQEKLGSLEGKKVVISWAYSPSVEKPIAVPQSMALGTSLFGANIVLAHPKGFDLDEKIIAKARENIKNHGGSLEIVHDMAEAFKDADVVYPKAWPVLSCLPPFNNKVDFDTMKNMFDENKNWKTTNDLMKLANPNCLYMHCLPADRGLEVTDEVMDGPNSVIFDQAENRLHAQKAVMVLTM